LAGLESTSLAAGRNSGPFLQRPPIRRNANPEQRGHARSFFVVLAQLSHMGKPVMRQLARLADVTAAQAVDQRVGLTDRWQSSHGRTGWVQCDSRIPHFPTRASG